MTAVAKEILSQLGGNKFRVMTGASNFIDAGNSLIFMFKGSRKMNKCQITLTPDDLYDMEFYQLRAKECRLIAEATRVYNDQLQGVFTNITGLDTHL